MGECSACTLRTCRKHPVTKPSGWHKQASALGAPLPPSLPRAPHLLDGPGPAHCRNQVCCAVRIKPLHQLRRAALHLLLQLLLQLLQACSREAEGAAAARLAGRAMPSPDMAAAGVSEPGGSVFCMHGPAAQLNSCPSCCRSEIPDRPSGRAPATNCGRLLLSALCRFTFSSTSCAVRRRVQAICKRAMARGWPS